MRLIYTYKHTYIIYIYKSTLMSKKDKIKIKNYLPKVFPFNRNHEEWRRSWIYWKNENGSKVTEKTNTKRPTANSFVKSLCHLLLIVFRSSLFSSSCGFWSPQLQFHNFGFPIFVIFKLNPTLKFKPTWCHVNILINYIEIIYIL